MSWRDSARPRIAAIIERVGTTDMKQLRKALRDAFPWGARKYHPYKIWCDEIRYQLGLKKTALARLKEQAFEAAGQLSLFSAEKEPNAEATI